VVTRARREARELYRVYDEQDFFAGAADSELLEAPAAAEAQRAHGREDPRLHLRPGLRGPRPATLIAAALIVALIVSAIAGFGVRSGARAPERTIQLPPRSPVSSRHGHQLHPRRFANAADRGASASEVLAAVAASRSRAAELPGEGSAAPSTPVAPALSGSAEFGFER
jgi:hypothetical protein